MPTLAEILRHPAPNLRYHPGSGLLFNWAEYHPDGMQGSSAYTFGPDGVMVAMRMLVYWDGLLDPDPDINTLVQLLGYSWRDPSKSTPKGTPYLRRKMPWQHPIWNQLYVKRISEVRGIRLNGTMRTFSLSSGPPGPGLGASRNYGPWTDFFLADLTIQFWRPPYYVRSDESIMGGTPRGPREWLRYTSKTWEMSLNMLSRENSTFQWLQGVKPSNSSPYFTGSVGQPVTHFRVSRTWYQIPERALFNTVADGSTDGLPDNLVYTRTAAENPLSKFDRALGSTLTTFNTNTTTTLVSTTNTTITTTRTTTTIATTTPSPSAIAAATGYVYPVGSPIGGCVNAPIGGGLAADGMGNWVDLTAASRLFGCYTGTLRYDGVTFTPQPLQLPPDLMRIDRINSIEAISQVQYDVTFHFDLFDPPTSRSYVSLGNPGGTPIKGHNLFPYAGNGLWYPILSQRDSADATSGPKLTPFMYADLTDLFYIL